MDIKTLKKEYRISTIQDGRDTETSDTNWKTLSSSACVRLFAEEKTSKTWRNLERNGNYFSMITWELNCRTESLMRIHSDVFLKIKKIFLKNYNTLPSSGI